MGFFMTLALEPGCASSPEVRLLVATGFPRFHTAFSTYGLDTIVLLSEHRLIPAVLYWAGSALPGIIGVRVGCRTGSVGTVIAGVAPGQVAATDLY